ncbi:MAG: hypothetical protein JXO49_06265 [Deltaproteobacteria bacterium]|nr:hypothetical protein [Candidatus Anaeroferrophillus wilburensis]MBN2888930.1 hypothetical protein [Deltaproteobacteria bacterium]
MGIKITDPSAVPATGGSGKNRPVSEQNAAGNFQDLLRSRIDASHQQSQGVQKVAVPQAPFPVYEIDELPELPQGFDLREKGIADTERLIGIMDAYHDKLDKGTANLFDKRRLIEDMEAVSRNMLGYMAHLTSADKLYTLMRDSVVMARVEIEKYVRGDYG